MVFFTHFMPDEAQLMIVTNRLHMWDAITRRELYSLSEIDSLLHSYNSYAFGAFGGDKKEKTRLYAVGASDGTIIVWDLQRGVTVNMLGITYIHLLQGLHSFT